MSDHDHKRIENRIRVSEGFKNFVLAHCGDADIGEWVEKQTKSGFRKEEKNEDFQKKIAELQLENETLKVQQPQPSTNSQEGPSGLTENPQQTQTQALALTPTEIISPNVQIVMIGGREFRVSNTQKEKAVWKDGYWTYSMNAAGYLAFLDTMGELGRHHAKELNRIRNDGLRDREKIRIEAYQWREGIRSGQGVDAQETPSEKYDPTAGAKWCPHRKRRVYPSECATCGQLDCEYLPKAQFRCPVNNEDPELCLQCQKQRLTPSCPLIKNKVP